MSGPLRTPHQEAVSAGMRRHWKKRPEQTLHKAVASYLRLALRPPTIWTTIGHGGGGKVRGALLKAMGMQPGWPDILVIDVLKYDTRVFGIELKAGRGVSSSAQKAVAKSFLGVGAFYEVCRSVEDVERFLRDLRVPLRGSVIHIQAAIEAGR